MVTLSPRRPKFDPGRFQAGFVVHEVISRVFRCCPVNIVRSKLRPHSPSSSKQPLSEGLSAKPGALSNERNFSLISTKAQQSSYCSLCLQNNVLRRTAGNLPRCTPTHDLHVAFKIPNLYYFITELRRQPAIVTHITRMRTVVNIGYGDVQHRQYSGLQARCRPSDRAAAIANAT